MGGGEGYFFPLLILRAQRKCEGRCGADGAIVQFFNGNGHFIENVLPCDNNLALSKVYILKNVCKFLFTYVKAMCGTREEGHTGPVTLSFFSCSFFIAKRRRPHNHRHTWGGREMR